MNNFMKCQLCSKHIESKRLYFNIDYITNEKFDIVLCDNCGLGHTVFDFNGSSLDKYYPPIYYGDGGNKALFSPVSVVMDYFREHRAREINGKFLVPGKILDIGCGKAIMLTKLNQLGWDCVGTERSEISAKKAKSNKKIDIRIAQDLMECNFKNNEFDVITMFHVLEHITNLNQVTHELIRILKPGGLLIIEVPNLDSFQSKLGGGKWFHIDAPRHLLHFTKSSLSKSICNVGFTKVGLETTSFEMGYFGALQTLLNVIIGRQNILYGDLLRTSSSTNKSKIANITIHTILLFPVLLFIFIFESIAMFTNNGSVLRMYFKK